MSLQNFPYEVDGPEDIMNDEKKDRMIVMPADEQGIYTKQKINNATISATHKNKFYR